MNHNISMKSVGIIPLRAGSKGIPNKNKKKLLGRPLFTWVLTEAIFSNLDLVYVYTDDKEILQYLEDNFSWADKVTGLTRSSESASDKASTEIAMFEFAEKINFDFDLICLLQATSPLTTSKNINDAIDKQIYGDYDSVLSVVPTKRFIWNKDGTSINYDFKKRPRRQDFEGLLMENGAIYISTKESFIENKNRIGGKIGRIEMEEDSLMEIDEPNDLVLVQELLKNRILQTNQGFNKIKALFLDVDGVFTDANVAVSNNGEFSKLFSVRDGMGLSLLKDANIEVFVITSENSEVVAQRMKKLGIKNTYLGIKDKYSFLQYLLSEKEYEKTNIAYLGDDINDMSNILSCGLGMCPNDAELAIINIADIVLKNKGGERVIREACEFILKYNQRF